MKLVDGVRWQSELQDRRDVLKASAPPILRNESVESSHDTSTRVEIAMKGERGERILACQSDLVVTADYLW